MSDVREVTEWHEAMEGTLTVAAERLHDAMADFGNATGIPTLARRLIHALSESFEPRRFLMFTTDTRPVPAIRHVAQQQMRLKHGWWAMLRAWVLGARR